MIFPDISNSQRGMKKKKGGGGGRHKQDRRVRIDSKYGPVKGGPGVSVAMPTREAKWTDEHATHSVIGQPLYAPSNKPRRPPFSHAPLRTTAGSAIRFVARSVGGKEGEERSQTMRWKAKLCVV